MNKKVFTSMLSLCVIFLCGLYIAKIFFPQEFIMVISNPQMIKIGNFVDTHIWTYYVMGVFTSFLTYWLYCCAICHKKYLNWKECLIILGVIGISILLSLYDVTLTSVFSVISMILLPYLFKGDMKYMSIVFSTHYLAQALTLRIRNLPLYFVNVSNFILFLVTIEMYLWLVLFYIIGNYNKKEV